MCYSFGHSSLVMWTCYATNTEDQDISTYCTVARIPTSLRTSIGGFTSVKFAQHFMATGTAMKPFTSGSRPRCMGLR